MHPKIIFAKFQTHANVIPSTITYNINMRYPDVQTRERNERAWRGCDAVRGGVSFRNAVSFYYLWYGSIYKRQCWQTLTLSKCVCMRVSGASELRKCWHFHILKLLFLSIFCWYIENKSWFNFIWEASAPQAPPPPPPVRQCWGAPSGKVTNARVWEGGVPPPRIGRFFNFWGQNPVIWCMQ